MTSADLQACNIVFSGPDLCYVKSKWVFNIYCDELNYFSQEAKSSPWWLTDAFDFSDGASLTWNEPPPIQTVQAGFSMVDHFSRRQFQDGTNASLTWQFTLTALKFKYLVLSLDGTRIAVTTASIQMVNPRFENDFSISWIPDQAFLRLTVLNMTSEKNGSLFTCQVYATTISDSLMWLFRSNVQVDVLVSLKWNLGTYVAYIYLLYIYLVNF